MQTHRRHRKEPSSPLPSNDNGDSLNTSSRSASSANDKGISSYIATARRRWNGQKDSDTLLPTTYAANSPSPRRGAMVTPTSTVCNNFLMGGHYYPGKDKKRRHMRRRTCWHRIFCSSRERKLASFLVLAYIVVYHVMAPLGGWLLETGVSISFGSGGRNAMQVNWLQHDSALQVPDLHQERAYQQDLSEGRARLQFGSNHRNDLRAQILNKIDPDWSSRNEIETKTIKAKPKEKEKKPSPSQELKTKPKETVEIEEKPETTAQKIKEEEKQGSEEKAIHGIEPEDNGNVSKSSSKKTTLHDSSSKNAQKFLEVSGQQYPVRTLDTMVDLESSHPRCSATTPEQDLQTTLVLQTSLNRLWILHETCARWSDPIVAVVFIPMDTTQPEVPKFECKNIELIFYKATEEESHSSHYPVNRLRNVGLAAVKTGHILVMDVDFLPADGLAENIHHALSKQKEVVANVDQRALIVPAFERLPPTPCETAEACAQFLQKDSAFIPSTFSELQECTKSEECVVFQSLVNWEGHSSTNSKAWLQRKWFEDDEETKFVSLPCFHTARYEPYLVLRWCRSIEETDSAALTPFYDERFHGYGKNKIQLVSHLRKSGFRFSILPEGFIVHNPHPESSVKQKWNDRDGSNLHSDMDALYSKFLHDLDKKYESFHDNMIKLCERG